VISVFTAFIGSHMMPFKKALLMEQVPRRAGLTDVHTRHRIPMTSVRAYVVIRVNISRVKAVWPTSPREQVRHGPPKEMQREFGPNRQ